MNQRTFFLLPLGVAILISGITPVRSQSEAPGAESILQEMAKAYAAAQSYSDKSTATYRNRDGSERLLVGFRIWFARPSSFRVDAESRPPGAVKAARREVLWADSAAVRTWATDKAVTTRPKVQLAGSKMFGTYAYHIPTLLEPSYGSRRRLVDLSSPALVGEEAFEGDVCYRLSGQWEGDAYEVWVGKADYLVRKIVATYGDHQMEEIHREISLDQPIPRETFRFAPENEALPSDKKKMTPPKR